jgi:hypothetical protein
MTACPCRTIYRDGLCCALCKIEELKAQLKTARTDTMDEFGILHGDEAAKLLDLIENPRSPTQALIDLLKGNP